MIRRQRGALRAAWGRHIRGGMIRVVAACACVGGVAVAGVQHAAAQASPGPSLPDLVGQLKDPNCAVRERATQMLSGTESFTLGEIEGVLKRDDLTLEQRTRLLDAAKDRFMNSPRAALGVTQLGGGMGGLPLSNRVVVEKTWPKFPAFKLLEEGDMIVEVEGEVLRSQDAWYRLGAHIISHDPGERMHMVVRRGDKKLEFTVELGNFRDLENNRGGGASPDPGRLTRAWEVRSARFNPTVQEEPIRVGIASVNWDGGIPPESPDEAKRARVKMQLPQLYRPRVVAGGQPRGGEVEYEEILNSFNAANRMDRRAWQIFQQQQGMPWEGNRPSRNRQQEIADVEGAMAALKENGTLQPGGVVQVERDRDRQDRTKLAAIYEKVLRALRAEAAEVRGAVVEETVQPSSVVPR